MLDVLSDIPVHMVLVGLVVALHLMLLTRLERFHDGELRQSPRFYDIMVKVNC